MHFLLPLRLLAGSLPLPLLRSNGPKQSLPYIAKPNTSRNWCATSREAYTTCTPRTRSDQRCLGTRTRQRRHGHRHVERCSSARECRP
ncbi:hypothetical protein B0F90DRAFT_1765009 [Multifurca ochricompacta]|uniref:Secreted protein n=1 Tax=Multifurca ochricompacta TaxID=376703 RepID=A0AAD4LXC2_9AGAM|nr:hypothetical protein B0F90DRAFT_1765009 [Multifurca ochricompacta]